MEVSKLIMIGLLCCSVSVGHAATTLEDDLSEVGSEAMFSESQGRIDLHAIQYAFDDTDPMSNTLVVDYKEGATIKVAVREFMATAIYFPEEIESFVLGDKVNFKWTPSKDKRWGYLQVKNRGADTNLILVGTSKNPYNVYVRSIGVENDKLPLLMVKYTNADIAAKNSIKTLVSEDAKKSGIKGEYLRHLKGIKAEDINTQYYFKSGNHSLYPKLVFDDGVFTYFKFADDNLDKVRRLPILYRVIDGYDNPVNTRVSGGTLIAETISDKWTLRHGEAHACIRKGGKTK